MALQYEPFKQAPRHGTRQGTREYPHLNAVMSGQDPAARLTLHRTAKAINVMAMLAMMEVDSLQGKGKGMQARARAEWVCRCGVAELLSCY